MSTQPPAHFSWQNLGNIATGRPNLGHLVPVAVYRLLQYTMRDVLVDRLGATVANELFIQAGKLAGSEFCRARLDCSRPFAEFVAQLQQVLKEQAIGILRIEKANLATMEITLTLAEDLDCSGLPVTNETVCHYDEGFLAGVFETYTGKPFTAWEIDCWASGDRVCRFIAQEDRGQR